MTEPIKNTRLELRDGREECLLRGSIRFALFAVWFLLPLLSGCAGYQLGNRSLYRPDVRTVYVPMFESDSLRRNLGERLTEAVVKEIETTTPFKVISDPALADSILRGRLVVERKATLAETRTDEPRDVETNVVVAVSWVDRQGFGISQDSTLSLAQQGFSVAQTADYVAEAGQSVSTAHQEAIQRIAKQIVSQMEAPW
jgi:hypothetical protein